MSSQCISMQNEQLSVIACNFPFITVLFPFLFQSLFNTSTELSSKVFTISDYRRNPWKRGVHSQLHGFIRRYISIREESLASFACLLEHVVYKCPSFCPCLFCRSVCVCAVSQDSTLTEISSLFW